MSPSARTHSCLSVNFRAANKASVVFKTNMHFYLIIKDNSVQTYGLQKRSKKKKVRYFFVTCLKMKKLKERVRMFAQLHRSALLNVMQIGCWQTLCYIPNKAIRLDKKKSHHLIFHWTAFCFDYGTHYHGIVSTELQQFLSKIL